MAAMIQAPIAFDPDKFRHTTRAQAKLPFVCHRIVSHEAPNRWSGIDVERGEAQC